MSYELRVTIYELMDFVPVAGDVAAACCSGAGGAVLAVVVCQAGEVALPAARFCVGAGVAGGQLGGDDGAVRGGVVTAKAFFDGGQGDALTKLAHAQDFLYEYLHGSQWWLVKARAAARLMGKRLR